VIGMATQSTKERFVEAFRDLARESDWNLALIAAAEVALDAGVLFAIAVLRGQEREALDHVRMINDRPTDDEACRAATAAANLISAVVNAETRD
jgi:hypothetical protein